MGPPIRRSAKHISMGRSQRCAEGVMYHDQADADEYIMLQLGNCVWINYANNLSLPSTWLKLYQQ